MYDNTAKDTLNVCAAIAFAKQTGQELHWYYAEDKHKKSTITDEHLMNYLTHLPSGQTQQQLGRVPLILGMPILVSQNFDVKGGIINGSQSTVSHIHYHVDDEGHHYLLSVVVHITDSTDENLSHLLPHNLPILADMTAISFKHPYSDQNCRIHCTQVPILPAFTMTVHQAQGQTLDSIIIDLQSCKGTEAPYDMASCAHSLHGLLILHPFEKGLPFTAVPKYSQLILRISYVQGTNNGAESFGCLSLRSLK